MRDIGVQFIALEGMMVVVHVRGCALPSLELDSSWEEGPVDSDGAVKPPSLQN